MRRPHTLTFVAVIAAFCLIGLTVGITKALDARPTQHEITEQRVAALVKVQKGSCDRGNVVRAYLRFDAARSVSHSNRVVKGRVANTLFPILDCEQTVKTGAPVALSRTASRLYMKLTIPGFAG